MPFRIFPVKGGGQALATAHPFQIQTTQALSGAGRASMDAKCPCDTGTNNYTSSNFFNFSPSQINQSGKLAFQVYSGSNLYQSLSMTGQVLVNSYVANWQDVDTDKEKDSPAMRIYGLQFPVFIEDFFPQNYSGNDTLKIWLTVCYPSGQDEDEAEASMDAADTHDLTLRQCKERANKQMGAFISCSTGAFPPAAIVRLINKGTSTQPRFEKRQVAANIAIGEVNVSGTVVHQYLKSNLCLTDINVQGFPCRMPLSVFSE